MNKVLHADFETRSAVDIKKSGADVYARHPSTDFLCLGYQFDDGPRTFIKRNAPLPKEVRDHIICGGRIVGHNVPFELAIWNHVCVHKYAWPCIDLEQAECTMAMAYAMGLPGSLEKAAAAMGITEQKDLAGSRVMQQLSRPREILPDGTIIWWEETDVPEKFEILYKYCLQDVAVEHELYTRLLKLSDRERQIWLMDQRINQRGIQIDLENAARAMKIVDSEKKRLDEAMRKVTKDQVVSCSAVKQLTDWVNNQGITLESVAKADLTAALEKEIPEDVRAALSYRQEAAKSSTAKLEAMRLRACTDGRVRGIHQYHGAGTGRWAGRGIQTQNFPRPQIVETEQVEEIFECIKKGSPREIDMFYGPPMTIISDLLRSFIVAAPGKKFIAGDFSSIESRVLAWLAGGEKKLQIFRTHGKIYEHEAAGIYRIHMDDVDEDQRQTGKVAELSLGFQGGKGAFQQMAKNYSLKVSDEFAEQIKNTWRANNPEIVQYWYALESAAIAAVQNPGRKFKAGAKGREVTYLKNGSFLFCQLPSGRAICYPYPKVEQIVTPWGAAKEGLTYMSEDALTHKWERQKAYGGLLCENNAQGVARDILADAMIRLENNNYLIAMHIHDEDVCEVDKHFGSVKEFETIMAQVPTWAEGLPIAVKGWEGMRFRK